MANHIYKPINRNQLHKRVAELVMGEVTYIRATSLYDDEIYTGTLSGYTPKRLTLTKGNGTDISFAMENFQLEMANKSTKETLVNHLNDAQAL